MAGHRDVLTSTSLHHVITTSLIGYMTHARGYCTFEVTDPLGFDRSGGRDGASKRPPTTTGEPEGMRLHYVVFTYKRRERLHALDDDVVCLIHF